MTISGNQPSKLGWPAPKGLMANALPDGPEVAHYVGKDTATAKWVMSIGRREHFR